MFFGGASLETFSGEAQLKKITLYFVIHFYSPQKNFEKENEDLCNSAVEFRDVSSLI